MLSCDLIIKGEYILPAKAKFVNPNFVCVSFELAILVLMNGKIIIKKRKVLTMDEKSILKTAKDFNMKQK
ncbi:MAG: hypothetical protein U9R06_01005 [Patescibacteria group bacterium]|nr:hypothetical protein [Patescibacteria group bacterium]